MNKKKYDILYIVPNHPTLIDRYKLIAERVSGINSYNIITQNEVLPQYLNKYIKIIENIFKKITSRGIGIGRIKTMLTVNYLVKHNSKIIFFFNESYRYTKYLRKYNYITTINLAHAVTYKSNFYSRLFFDYYLIYGKSSIVNMQSNKNLIIKSNVKIVGPAWIEAGKLLSEGSKYKINCKYHKNLFKKTVLITSQWANKQVKSYLEPNYRVICEFIEKNNDICFLIKEHPLEKGEDKYWVKLKENDNVEIIDGNINGFAFLKDIIDVHVTVFSNSAIDLAMLKIPTIFFDKKLDKSSYLTPPNYSSVATNTDELKQLLYTQKNVAEIEDFIEYHIFKSDFKSLERVRQCVHSILNGKDLDDVIHPDEIKKPTIN